MKMLKTILAALILFVGSNVSFAAVEGMSPSPQSELRDRVVELLSNKYYDSLKSGEEVEARITFVLNRNMEIVVLDVNTEDSVIDDSIRNSLNYKKAEIEGITADLTTPYHIDITIQGARN